MAAGIVISQGAPEVVGNTIEGQSGRGLVVGAAMVASIVIAWSSILRRNVPRHEAFMIRAYALGQGAGTQALVLGPWIGLTLFGAFTGSWALMFVFQSKSVGQYAASGIGFVVAFVGTLGMVAAEVMLSGEQLAGTDTRLSLELGGKAANVIFDDAPIDQAGHLLLPTPALPPERSHRGADQLARLDQGSVGGVGRGGALDVRAKTINDAMKIAAAEISFQSVTYSPFIVVMPRLAVQLPGALVRKVRA